MQKELKFVEIAVAQWQGENRSGMGYTIIALGEDGCVYQQSKVHSGFFKLNMQEVSNPDLEERPNGKSSSNHLRR